MLLLEDQPATYTGSQKCCKCPVQANWAVSNWYVVNSKSAFPTKVCPCSNVNSAQKSSRFKDLTLSEVRRYESCPGTIYLRPPSLKFTDKDPLNLGNLHFSVDQVGMQPFIIMHNRGEPTNENSCAVSSTGMPMHVLAE